MFGLAAIGSTIANSSVGRWAVGVGLAVLIFLYWLARYTDGVRKTERIRMERRSRKTQKVIRKENNEKLAKAERTRADFRAYDADDDYELSDDAIRRLTRGAARDE